MTNKEDLLPIGVSPRNKNGIRIRPGLAFPSALYEFLRLHRDNNDMVTFQPHGRAFLVRDQERFSQEFFGLWPPSNLANEAAGTDWVALQELLGRFGFRSLQSPGPDQGAYYHELFLRGQPSLAGRIQEQPYRNTTANGSGVIEPSFSAMPQLRSWSTESDTMSNLIPSATTAATFFDATPPQTLPRTPFPLAGLVLANENILLELVEDVIDMQWDDIMDDGDDDDGVQE